MLPNFFSSHFSRLNCSVLNGWIYFRCGTNTICSCSPYHPQFYPLLKLLFPLCCSNVICLIKLLFSSIVPLIICSGFHCLPFIPLSLSCFTSLAYPGGEGGPIECLDLSDTGKCERGLRAALASPPPRESCLAWHRDSVTCGHFQATIPKGQWCWRPTAAVDVLLLGK